MTKSNAPSRQRLFQLLDKIVGEERSFKRRSRDISAQNQPLSGNGSSDQNPPAGDELERLRLAHEEMFKIHSKFINDHELLIQRCLTISRQTRAGLLNENEIALEVERLQTELRRIKKEHSLVEKEYQQLLQPQSRYVGDLDRKG